MHHLKNLEQQPAYLCGTWDEVCIDGAASYFSEMLGAVCDDEFDTGSNQFLGTGTEVQLLKTFSKNVWRIFNIFAQIRCSNRIWLWEDTSLTLFKSECSNPV